MLVDVVVEVVDVELELVTVLDVVVRVVDEELEDVLVEEEVDVELLEVDVEEVDVLEEVVLVVDVEVLLDDVDEVDCQADAQHTHTQSKQYCRKLVCLKARAQVANKLLVRPGRRGPDLKPYCTNMQAAQRSCYLWMKWMLTTSSYCWLRKKMSLCLLCSFCLWLLSWMRCWWCLCLLLRLNWLTCWCCLRMWMSCWLSSCNAH